MKDFLKIIFNLSFKATPIDSVTSAGGEVTVELSPSANGTSLITNFSLKKYLIWSDLPPCVKAKVGRPNIGLM